jgi:secreted PhoX family phosphatase
MDFSEAESAQGKFGFGPLRKDRKGILDLPDGFRYKIISRAGDKMDDGFYVPHLPDGMAAFPGPDGLTIVIRNHEFRIGNDKKRGAFKDKEKLWKKMDSSYIYDQGPDGKPLLGGTTTLVYDTKKQKLKGQYLSLIGTLANCSGGITPWGTWISCEEACYFDDEVCSRYHGYAFEVPLSVEPVLTKPVPLKAMGRFTREGVAFDPRTNIGYQTEDKTDSLLYRFIPDQEGDLVQGGRLQCLGIVDKPGFDLRNWKLQNVAQGDILDATWIDLENPDPDEDNLRLQGQDKGAALFASGEGVAYFDGAVYFDCTNGGRIGKGQIWKYKPSPYEGTPKEADVPGKLELFVEPNDPNVLDHPDQLTVAPWGDIMVCEDGKDDQYLLGITPERQIYRFARNALNDSELAGVCFSPDRTTMFLNNLATGLTFAITGPWKK